MGFGPTPGLQPLPGPFPARVRLAHRKPGGLATSVPSVRIFSESHRSSKSDPRLLVDPFIHKSACNMGARTGATELDQPAAVGYG